MMEIQRPIIRGLATAGSIRIGGSTMSKKLVSLTILLGLVLSIAGTAWTERPKPNLEKLKIKEIQPDKFAFKLIF